MLREGGTEKAQAIARQEIRELQGTEPHSWSALLGEGVTILPAGHVPQPSSLSADIEGNLNHALQHYLAALKLFDTTEVPASQLRFCLAYLYYFACKSAR